MRVMMTVAGAMLLAGCGGEGGGAPAKTEVANKIGAGLYEVTAEVASLTSTDKSTPATKVKQGDKISVQACVGEDGALDPSLLAEAGDTCTTPSSYARKGRLSVQLACQRAGANGGVMVTTDGKFTADTFIAEAQSETQFYGTGDYKMTRKITARRVGDCPAGGVKAAS